MSLNTIFKNGGENYSFARTSAGFALVICLALVVTSAIHDLTTPWFTITVQHFDMATKTAYTTTERVGKLAWSDYIAAFGGIITLVGGLYALGKFGGAAQTAAENIGKS